MQAFSNVVAFLLSKHFGYSNNFPPENHMEREVKSKF